MLTNQSCRLEDVTLALGRTCTSVCEYPKSHSTRKVGGYLTVPWFEILAQEIPLNARSPRQPANGLNSGAYACACVAVEAPRHLSSSDAHLRAGRRGTHRALPTTRHAARTCTRGTPGAVLAHLESQCRATKENRYSTVTDFAISWHTAAVRPQCCGAPLASKQSPEPTAKRRTLPP